MNSSNTYSWLETIGRMRLSLLAVATGLMLMACGGGNDSSVSTSKSPSSTPIYSSDGNLLHFLGTWGTPCLKPAIGFNGVSGIRNAYVLTGVNGNVVFGNFYQWQYRDDKCQNLDSSFGVKQPVTRTVSLSFGSSMPIVGEYEGKADAVNQVLTKISGESSSTPLVIGLLSVGGKTMLIGTNNTIDRNSVAYFKD